MTPGKRVSKTAICSPDLDARGTLVGLVLLAILSAAADAAPVRSLLEMRQQRVVMQEWDLSCGVAAVATILRYQYGDPVSEKEIALALMQREEYQANPELVQAREGFSLLDFARYLESRGYRGVGLGQLSIADLIQRAPIMVPVDFDGYPHFVVFRGAVNNHVLLADPAWGNRTMRIKQFESGWLDLPGLGKVGFQVLPPGDDTPPNRLAPAAEDFVLLR
jgi:uncharacterized protein